MQLTVSARVDYEEEARLEKMDIDMANAGCAADIVFVYNIEDTDTLKQDRSRLSARMKETTEKGFKEKMMGLFSSSDESAMKEFEDDLADMNKRNDIRAETIVTMRKVGITVVKHKTHDGTKMLVKITAPLQRLEKEAQRLGIEMRLKEELNDPDRPDVPTYRDFDRETRDDFQRKEGRLFSTLERQRLIFSLLEGPRFEGLAQLDLDAMVNDKAFILFTAIHSEKEREDLIAYWASWKSFRMWPFKLYGKKQRMWPDLGAIEQPLNMVRDYFGEKVTPPSDASPEPPPPPRTHPGAHLQFPCRSFVEHTSYHIRMALHAGLPAALHLCTICTVLWRTSPDLHFLSSHPIPSQVTLYFAWMEHYTLALLGLAFVAFLQAILSSSVWSTCAQTDFNQLAEVYQLGVV